MSSINASKKVATPASLDAVETQGVTQYNPANASRKVASPSSLKSNVTKWIPTPSPSFSPLDLSPTLWLDASDATTITESGGAVSQWDDKSGNGNNFVQATSANQPTSGTRTLNSLNVIDFDGTSDFLDGGDIADPLSGGITMIGVAKIDDDTKLNGLWGKARSVDTAGRYSMFYNATPRFRSFWEDTAHRRADYDPGAGNRTDTYIISSIIERDDSNTLRLNGSQVAIDSTLSGTTSYNNGFSFYVGAFQGSGGTSPYANSYLDGFIAELIVMNATATAQQISDTETYLADKWGITI